MILFNESSNDHLSVLLFGGELKYKEPVLVGLIKTGVNKGKEKFKLENKLLKTKGVGIVPKEEWKSSKEGFFLSNEKILEEITKGENLEAKEICSLILDIRKLNKELSTYFLSTRELVYDLDYCVHPNYLHVKTGTGRLAHNTPNMGNQPKSPSKATQHFVSRFKDGVIMIADYKSLEPRVEAQLSEDKNLRQDVVNGVDTHTKHLALAEKVTYDQAADHVASGAWKDKRSKIKGFTFSQQYLAGVKTTVRNSGLSEQEVTDLIVVRKEEYKGLYLWHEKNSKEVNSNGYYISPLGQMFYFTKYPSKWKFQGDDGYYSPNEMSNYMTQGTAGCIVNIMIGKFWREKAIYNRKKYLMINTVHDNLMLDVKDIYKEDAKKDLQLLEEWDIISKVKFNYNWAVELKVEISEGESWYDCS